MVEENIRRNLPFSSISIIFLPGKISPEKKVPKSKGRLQNLGRLTVVDLILAGKGAASTARKSGLFSFLLMLVPLVNLCRHIWLKSFKVSVLLSPAFRMSP